MAPKFLVGVFHSPEALLSAAVAAREAGAVVHDAYTPFPVHGMDEALGLAPSALPKACLAFALAGLCGALSFEYWVSVFDWPMNIGGKSFNASPALLPVAFELTVLVAGLGSVAFFLHSRGLLPGRKPELSDLGATDDRFLLALSVTQDAARWKGFLSERGALRVEEREQP